jgi:hypothetical protein
LMTMHTVYVVALVTLTVPLVAFAGLWGWELTRRRKATLERDTARRERDAARKDRDQYSKAAGEWCADHSRAQTARTAAEKRCVEAWKALETEKAGREQDGVTAQARYGQLVAERDALRRKLEVRGAEAGLMFEVMAEWLRSHGYKVEG